MDPVVPEFYVTFGVQYGRREDDDQHPLHMYGDGYAVIEAPDMEMARRIAFAIFEQQWAFIYGAEFMLNDRRDEWHPAGELLRIAWLPK